MTDAPAPDPALTAALADARAGRVTIANREWLLTHPAPSGPDDSPADPIPAQPDARPALTLTRTFTDQWTHLSVSGADRDVIIGAMHGIAHEPRHPAFRTVRTTLPQVYEATIADLARVCFLAAGSGRHTWLTITALAAPTRRRTAAPGPS